MHPIEHLRYVARSHGADPVEVALGAADALAGVSRDPGATMVSARRLVEHHPLNGQLWSVCAHAVTAMDPRREVEDVAASIASDPTASHLVAALPDDATVCTVGWSGHLVDALVRRGDVRALVVDSLGDGQDTLRVIARRDVACELVAPEGAGTAAVQADVTVVPVFALSDGSALCPGGALAVASSAYCAGRPVWLVAPAAARVADGLYAAMVAESLARPDPWAAGVDEVPLGVVSAIVGPQGSDLHPSRVGEIPASPHAPELLRRSVV